jgi:streptomycin 6-kinase
LIIPARIIAACSNRPKHEAWLARLPGAVGDLERRWSLVLGSAFDNASSAWVAPVTLADGTEAVLKLGMPHSECEHEIDGLRFWSGEPTVRLLDADRELGAMLLERCEPGNGLWLQPKPEQDLVLAGVLKRLWRTPIDPHPFRHLSKMLSGWSARTQADAGRWPDAGLVREGLNLLAELPGSATREVLLATDLHAGNVLRAQREPWLAIDPRPHIGDPAYDATQHLLNRAKARSDPAVTIRRFAEIADLDPERVRLWTFARAAAQPRDDWSNDLLFELARAIAP